MRHPDPLHLCRHVVLYRRPDGRKQCIFRANPLNPARRWGKPVPLAPAKDGPPTLVFDTFVAPLDYYLPALEDTSCIALDATAFHINPTDESIFTTRDKTIGLRDFNPSRAAPGSSAGIVGSADYQDKLRDLRDRVACKLVHSLMEKGVTKPLTHLVHAVPPSDERTWISPKQAVGEAAVRIGLSVASLYRILYEREGFTLLSQRVRGSHRDPTLPKLSTSVDFRQFYKEVHNAIVAVRTQRVARSKVGQNIPCTFSMHDLAIPSEPGGYPTVCPVTGLEFEWGVMEGASMCSPKVACIDPMKGYVTGNVMLATKIAKRILDETTSVDTAAAFLSNKPEAIEAMEKWFKDLPFVHTAEDLLTTIKRRIKTTEAERKTNR